MSWLPGVGPVKDVSAVGVSRGLSEDWYSDTAPHKSNRTEIDKGSFWDIIDNPLYEVAAGAAGFDWATWVEEAKGKVGTSPNSGSTRVRAVITRGRPAVTRSNIGPNSATVTTPAVSAEYEWMTIDEAEERGLDYEGASTGRWRNTETGEISDRRPIRTDRFGIEIDDSDNWEEMRNWGILDEGIAEDLDEMSGWLSEIVNINKHLHPTILEGPQGKHYGIEGDIWEHYGLDKEPEPPKELEWDSYDKKMNLKVADRSTRTYSTPKGIQPIDLHGTDTDYSEFKE